MGKRRKRRKRGRGWFLEGGQETVKGIEPSKPLARILNSLLLRPPLETPLRGLGVADGSRPTSSFQHFNPSESVDLTLERGYARS